VDATDRPSEAPWRRRRKTCLIAVAVLAFLSYVLVVLAVKGVAILWEWWSG